MFLVLLRYGSGARPRRHRPQSIQIKLFNKLTKETTLESA